MAYQKNQYIWWAYNKITSGYLMVWPWIWERVHAAAPAFWLQLQPWIFVISALGCLLCNKPAFVCVLFSTENEEMKHTQPSNWELYHKSCSKLKDILSIKKEIFHKETSLWVTWVTFAFIVISVPLLSSSFSFFFFRKS